MGRRGGISRRVVLRRTRFARGGSVGGRPIKYESVGISRKHGLTDWVLGHFVQQTFRLWHLHQRNPISHLPPSLCLGVPISCLQRLYGIGNEKQTQRKKYYCMRRGGIIGSEKPGRAGSRRKKGLSFIGRKTLREE
jgi:hypothetical protein